MALRDRITNFQPVATATLATVATLGPIIQRTVARVATVAVADEEKKEKNPGPADRQPERVIPRNAEEPTESQNTPAICTNCERLEIVEIMGKPVSGCLYPATGEYPDGWRRLPDSLKKCMWPGIKFPVTSRNKREIPGVHQLENIKGLSWIDQNRKSLKDAGFTDNDLYGQHPTGISLLKLWGNNDLAVSLDGGTILFRWKGAAGKIITQTCSPERHPPYVSGSQV